jgi:hypothetical protein
METYTLTSGLKPFLLLGKRAVWSRGRRVQQLAVIGGRRSRDSGQVHSRRAGWQRPSEVGAVSTILPGLHSRYSLHLRHECMEILDLC